MVTIGRPIDAALAYARRGWPVFPLHSVLAGCCSCRRDCSHPVKHPLARHGLHEATRDERTLRGWWDRWPWANVGLVTGAASGLVVIDVDPAKGGTDSLARLRFLMGSLPETLAAATGGGGQHLLYSHPGEEVRNTAGRLPGIGEPLPGLDLRGDGGYIVAPPSRHASGRPYRWVDTTVPVAPAPGWLRVAPTRTFPTGGSPSAPGHGGSRYGHAALAREVSAVRAAAVGDRNNQLTRAAFCLGRRAAGGELDRALVEAELLAAAIDVGLTEPEARASIHSGLRAGAREPRRR
ncbi:MAG TPA: bifunctional DNA primase/polymerase, partial [Acidimicrobiia bacterium]|nr:bifunctional DNA primase/polymerase [Acidimicrobiia bacterium]